MSTWPPIYMIAASYPRKIDIFRLGQLPWAYKIKYIYSIALPEATLTDEEGYC